MARTSGKRNKPRARPSARPAPQRPRLPTKEDQPSGFGKKLLWVGVGLVGLVVAVAVGITLAGEDRDAAQAQRVDLPDEVTVEGSILPVYDPTVEDEAIGFQMPELFSIDFEGQPASIENDGVPKVILFLAHWCSFCQAEVPVVQNWINENGAPAGVDFVSVATSIDEMRPNYPPDAWLRGEGWTQRVVVDSFSGTIANAFGLSSYPYWVMVDGSGTVVRRVAGSIPPEQLGAAFQALAAGG